MKPFKLFGFEFGKEDKPPQEVDKKQASFTLPNDEDGAVAVEAAGFMGQFLDLDGSVRNDTELLLKYREMATNAEVESAIDDIVCEAIVTEDDVPSVKCVLDTAKSISVPTKKKISEEFDQILKLLKFQTFGYEIFRRWYVDSRVAYHKIIDPNKLSEGIKELRYIDPIYIQKVKRYEKELTPNGTTIVKNIETFFNYSRDGFKTNISSGTTAQSLKISPDAIAFVTSGLYDSRNKRVIGYLHKAIKPHNQLRMMEDALIIYRISRAPERRVFYVDVGNLPKQKAEAYVRDLMTKHKNKLTYDAQTGEMRDDRRFMSMLEDFWMPRREGGKGTEIDTLAGSESTGFITDLDYFKKKLYKSLSVPFSRMDGEQKSFTIGKSTEINRDELKFGKFVTRLRNKFCELFYDLLRTQLLLKNIVTAEEWEELKNDIYFNFNRDSYFTELKQQELMIEKMNTVSMMDPYIGKFFSRAWVNKNILNFNEEELEQMEKEIKEEKEQDAEEQAEMGIGPDGMPMGNDPLADPMGGSPPPGNGPPGMPPLKAGPKPGLVPKGGEQPAGVGNPLNKPKKPNIPKDPLK